MGLPGGNEARNDPAHGSQAPPSSRHSVVEPASVIGVTFFEPAVEEMVPGPVRASVGSHLTTLDGKQFVARDPSDPDEETYRFRHGLIREATYGSLLKRTRAQLHERFVAWAERVGRFRDSGPVGRFDAFG